MKCSTTIVVSQNRIGGTEFRVECDRHGVIDKSWDSRAAAGIADKHEAGEPPITVAG